jgi:hypothetical protein
MTAALPSYLSQPLLAPPRFLLHSPIGDVYNLEKSVAVIFLLAILPHTYQTCSSSWPHLSYCNLYAHHFHLWWVVTCLKYMSETLCLWYSGGVLQHSHFCNT